MATLPHFVVVSSFPDISNECEQVGLLMRNECVDQEKKRTKFIIDLVRQIFTMLRNAGQQFVM